METKNNVMKMGATFEIQAFQLPRLGNHFVNDLPNVNIREQFALFFVNKEYKLV